MFWVLAVPLIRSKIDGDQSPSSLLRLSIGTDLSSAAPARFEKCPAYGNDNNSSSYNTNDLFDEVFEYYWIKIFTFEKFLSFMNCCDCAVMCSFMQETYCGLQMSC